jgi:transposase
LIQIYQNTEIRLIYLLSYSPNFNPIEEAFAELKAWMRKNYLLAEGFESFRDFIAAGLTSLSSKIDAYFHSYYIHI